MEIVNILAELLLAFMAVLAAVLSNWEPVEEKDKFLDRLVNGFFVIVGVIIFCTGRWFILPLYLIAFIVIRKFEGRWYNLPKWAQKLFGFN